MTNLYTPPFDNISDKNASLFSSSIHSVFSDSETHETIRKSSLVLASLITTCLHNKKLVGICGNGGSSADAQHFSSELVCTYRSTKRPPISAIALTTDSSLLTAWSNDVSFDSIFSRQVLAHRHLLGCLLAFSTSGRSSNVLNALKACTEYDIPSALVTGNHDFEQPADATLVIRLPSADTPVIQLLSSYLYHETCEVLEKILTP